MTSFATWGLFFAWLIHDIEELFTMPRWSQRSLAPLDRALPRAALWIRSRTDFSLRYFTIAIILMGSVIFAAAADGARTGGASVFYQTVLIAFGIHALFHIGHAVAVRGYSPGVFTSPTVVVPFSLWAWWAIERAHVVTPTSADNIVPVLVGFPAVMLSVHGLAMLIFHFLPRPGAKALPSSGTSSGNQTPR